jgi:hypothetical protein
LVSPKAIPKAHAEAANSLDAKDATLYSFTLVRIGLSTPSGRVRTVFRGRLASPGMLLGITLSASAGKGRTVSTKLTNFLSTSTLPNFVRT